MSAEGKKKRGSAGASHGKTCAFRGNGRPPDWMARNVGATHSPSRVSGGSTTMRGLLGGILAAKLGFPMVGDYERAMADAQPRCTHPYLAAGIDEPEILDDAQQEKLAEAA